MPQTAHNLRKMVAVADLQHEIHGRIGTFSFHGNVVNVGAGPGDCRRHPCQYATLIGDHCFDVYLEMPGNPFTPCHVQPIVRASPVFGDYRAIMDMYYQSLVFLDETDDGIPRNRAAAFGKLHRHAFGTEDGDDVASPIYSGSGLSG